MEFPVENKTQGGIKKIPISIPKKTILKNSDNYFLQY